MNLRGYVSFESHSKLDKFKNSILVRKHGKCPPKKLRQIKLKMKLPLAIETLDVIHGHAHTTGLISNCTIKVQKYFKKILSSTRFLLIPKLKSSVCIFIQFKERFQKLLFFCKQIIQK